MLTQNSDILDLIMEHTYMWTIVIMFFFCLENCHSDLRSTSSRVVEGMVFNCTPNMTEYKEYTLQGIQLTCGHENNTERYIAKVTESNGIVIESSIPLTNVTCDAKVNQSASHLRVFILDKHIWTSLGLLLNTCKCFFYYINHMESNISVKPNKLNFNQLWCDSDGVANSSATNLTIYHSEEELILYRTDDTSSFKGTTVFVHNNESAQYTCSVRSNDVKINLNVSATPEDLETRNSPIKHDNGEETNSNVIILSVTLSVAAITGCVITILLRKRCACRNGHPPWCSQHNDSLNNRSDECTDGDPTSLL